MIFVLITAVHTTKFEFQLNKGWFHLFPSSQLFTLYSWLVSRTLLEQLILAEFIGEYARPKDPQTQLTGMLIIKTDFVYENKEHKIKLDCFNCLNNIFIYHYYDFI